MPLNREDKQAVVAEVSAQVAKAQTVVLAEYRGIAVGDLTKLRAQAREQKVYLRVLKNTLARRAVEGTPFAPLAEQMTGPLIYGISEDAIAAAKVVNDFGEIGVGRLRAPPTKPVTFAVFFTRCHVSSVISISTST